MVVCVCKIGTFLHQRIQQRASLTITLRWTLMRLINRPKDPPVITEKHNLYSKENNIEDPESILNQHLMHTYQNKKLLQSIDNIFLGRI